MLIGALEKLVSTESQRGVVLFAPIKNSVGAGTAFHAAQGRSKSVA
jgi:hypothetical protein